MTACGPGCRWEVRVLRLGEISRNEIWWPISIGPALAAKLPGAFVGLFWDGAKFAHRPDAAIQLADVVGVVESATSTADDVRAVVHLLDEATILRRALCALERDRRLTDLGVSLVASVDRVFRVNCGRRVELVTGVRDVVSVDIVSRPGADGRFLRSLASEPAPAPLHTTTIP